jgi:hypothetical protein
MLVLLYFIVLFIILSLLAFKIYIKKLSSFWYIQPVFHVYNLPYWFKTPGIIDPKMPEFNKFCNIINIRTKDISTLTDLQIQTYTNFIKTNFLITEHVKYLPSKNEIFPFFQGFNHPTFISTYEKPTYFITQSEGKTINSNALVGLMTSRPLTVTLKDRRPFSIYYVDYLCVDKTRRKGGVAPQIIQTHVYNERRLNKKIKVSFFKRETELTNIIPLTSYYTYKIPLSLIKSEALPHAAIKLIEITKQTIHLLLEFIFKQKEKFSCIIVPELGNILALLETENIFIYGLLENQELCACYIFKNSMVYYENERAVDFIASISNACFKEIFYIGFSIFAHKICKKLSASQIIFEMISDNIIIYEHFLKNVHTKFVSPTAYYFYNYRQKTIDSGDCFIFC